MTTTPPKKMTDQELADSWINEMTEAGLTYDQMLEVLKLARKKYEHLKLKDEYNDWIKLREESIDEWGEKLCYCGHTFKCDCGNPTLNMFKESVERGVITLGDKNNGWKNIL